ncbi:HAD family hydrolase [Tropicimonas sp. TH_r6]|uniref:sulfotransferase-like domain-containing protein n=1 Tax=Tropicimonas sp. TH_r6 TaxID=3082085 RepID=UPI002952EDE3|nr:HAD family hydrolase [Tropicimonas sp. TH_r6]MDV7144605.1 HAD family hydrolase [Tropicimonas sp. TH_r6]
MRIAMWSGPRNLSTAMMYAFANRADFAAVDEPFYAAYLAATGLEHPMRAEILAAQPKDPADVVAQLTGPLPADRPHFYQKHMTHHVFAGMPWDWMDDMVNLFLIRHPARVIASYAAKRENPTLDDIGFWQQADLFDHVEQVHGKAVVVDSHDIREDPEGMLRALCAEIGLDFDPAMLSWPAGGKACDGVWASHWYGAVWNSTGFAGREGPLPEVPVALKGVLDGAMPHYRRLAARALKPA